ncbi:hypothetical protein AAC387_Pa03g0110 [Persea americana]
MEAEEVMDFFFFVETSERYMYFVTNYKFSPLEGPCLRNLICSLLDPLVNPCAKTAGLDLPTPKPGVEINLVNAVPCRIAFERVGGKPHFCFLAVSRETSGWVLLAEELPLKQNFGIVHVVAPFPGSILFTGRFPTPGYAYLPSPCTCGVFESGARNLGV